MAKIFPMCRNAAEFFQAFYCPRDACTKKNLVQQFIFMMSNRLHSLEHLWVVQALLYYIRHNQYKCIIGGHSLWFKILFKSIKATFLFSSFILPMQTPYNNCRYSILIILMSTKFQISNHLYHFFSNHYFIWIMFYHKDVGKMVYFYHVKQSSMHWRSLCF